MKYCLTLALAAFFSTFADPTHAGLLWETRDKLEPSDIPLGCHVWCPPDKRPTVSEYMPVDRGYMWLD